MNKDANKVEFIEKEIVELNSKFHAKQLLTDIFYKQLIQSGFLFKQCLLISIFPDSCNTYCGQIIRQDGHIFTFDVDLDSSEYSIWKDVTEEFIQTYDKNKTIKPWLKEVVTYRMFSCIKGPASLKE